MEIEVGEYVRIKEKGIIGKIEQIGVSLFWLEDGSAFSIKEESYKHSKIISEIVEVGDYINGHRVEQVSIETNEVLLDHNGFGWRTLKYGDKIVTHEQFASIEYKVEEGK